MSLFQSKVQQLAELLLERKEMLATVESCTGGMLSQAITALPGSSMWFERGFVTYSNLSKQQQVNVDPQLILDHGAVSEQVAAAMAEGGLSQSAASYSVSVTGIAGPDGGTAEKPVGTVCFGWCSKTNGTITTTCHLGKDRHQIRRGSVKKALDGLIDLIIS